MNGVRGAVAGLGLAVLLSACGGGGGSGNDGTSSGPPSNVNVTPDALTINSAGSGIYPIVATARVSDPSIYDGPVYAVIDDPQHLLSGEVSIVQAGPSTFTVNATLSAGLAPKTYAGAFRVRICRDEFCNSPYANSTVSVPYNITVTATQLPGQSTASVVSGTVNALYPVGYASFVYATVEVSDPSVITGPLSIVLDDPQDLISDYQGLQISQGIFSTFAVTAVANPLPAGTYAGQLKARLCADDACAVPYPVAPLVIPYHFVIKQMMVRPTPLDHIAYRTGSPGSASVDLTIGTPSPVNGPVYFDVIDPSNVLEKPVAFGLVSPSSSYYLGDVTLSSRLPPGTYSGTLEVRACRDALCTQPYPGLSDFLPYSFEVTP